MGEHKAFEPSFNLWSQPWIGLEGADGSVERLGIEATLLECHNYKAIFEASPLAVAAIHRLLVAILQAAVHVQRNADLEDLWRAGRFPFERIKAFGAQCGHRFDIFSETVPFLQSADLPLRPQEGAKTKSVAYLSCDIPAGMAVTIYRHGSEDRQAFCPACVAAGLVCIPAFATSGGRGIKPSINGVPPIYVLPAGRTLFQSLAASLLTPDYRPRMASKAEDMAWWTRTPVVARDAEVREVGYLHSLTFPARRVRLHPESPTGSCSRCGSKAEWLVRTMIFETGESRPKTAETWLDPFAAYRKPDSLSRQTGPSPVRPVAGRAVWREYSSLFARLPTEGKTIRPRVLDQIAALSVQAPPEYFRCIGLRTDMKAKVFEWVDTSIEVPPAFLEDEIAGLRVEEGLQFAIDCSQTLRALFRRYAGRALREAGDAARRTERHRVLLNRMDHEYWSGLAAPFQALTLRLAVGEREAGDHQWADAVLARARAAFERAADQIGDDVDSLRASETAKKWCAIELAQRRKEYLNE